jgi:hypothetical protein
MLKPPCTLSSVYLLIRDVSICGFALNVTSGSDCCGGTEGGVPQPCNTDIMIAVHDQVIIWG